jgi:YegS/Rv2252/BmrU family lipid kinase
LGVLPLGTANDFARGCGLPSDDHTECLRIACTRDARAIDVGKANNRFFINVASAGFGAEITATTPIELKKKLGGTAYSLVGLTKVFNLAPYTGRLLIPGEDPLDGEMLFMAVGNNRYAGGGFDVAPHAKVDDGLLDLAAVRHPRSINLTQLNRELEDPMNPGNEFLYYRQLPEFTIEADEKLHWNLDGEPVLKKRLTFSVLPQHLGVAY